MSKGISLFLVFWISAGCPLACGLCASGVDDSKSSRRCCCPSEKESAPSLPSQAPNDDAASCFCSGHGVAYETPSKFTSLEMVPQGLIAFETLLLAPLGLETPLVLSSHPSPPDLQRSVPLLI